MYKLISKYHNIILAGFKGLTALLALGFLWRHRRLWASLDFPTHGGALKILSILLIFSLLNWFFEIKKWQVLAHNIQSISWAEAAKQSLMSFSISLLTPNRVGEYGAKMIFYPKKDYKKVWALTFIGNFSQLSLTLVMGLAALLFWWRHQAIQTYIQKMSFSILTILLIISGSGFLIWLLRRFYLKSKQQVLWQSQVWRAGLLYATLRYLIFSSQFVLLLYVLRHHLSFTYLYPAVFLSYLIATLIPMLAFFDWAVKSTVAIGVFSLINVPAAIVFKVVAMMWLTNFMLPFLIGLLLLWRYKIPLK